MTNKDKNIFNVKTLNSKTNYWVVRAGEDGTYLDHFWQNDLIAIGHIDDVEYSNEDLKQKKAVGFASKYKKSLIDSGVNSKSAGNKSSQVLSFIKKIKKGDVVISLSSSHFIVGIVTSAALKSTRQKLKRDSHGKVIGNPLTYSLRRRVSWGGMYSRKNIPSVVSSSLRANQTVFCVNDHWQTINHWLSVIFIKDNVVYFSSKIQQKEKIKNFDVSQYAQILNILEAICSKASEIKGDVEDIELESEIKAIYKACLKQRSFELNTQQSFMSPGDYWGSLSSSSRVKNILFILALCYLHDIEPVFASDADNQIVSQNKEIIARSVDIVKEEHGFSYVKNGLKLKVPKPYKLDDLDESNGDKQKKFPPKRPALRGEI